MMEIFTDIKLESFKQLILDCGKFMVSAALDENDSSDVMKKSGDADFVTVYDKGVQEKLITGLTALCPEAHFFAEEKDNFAEDTKNGLCFVIDPIDGTTNFIHNLVASTISVGALYNGRPVFGCVYDPYRGDLLLQLTERAPTRTAKKFLFQTGRCRQLLCLSVLHPTERRSMQRRASVLRGISSAIARI